MYLRSTIKAGFRSSSFRNTLTIITGTFLAQLITLALQPFLRRFFSPEDFGAFSVISTITMLLLDISTLKYELAIVLPKRDKDSANFFIIILITSVLINLVFTFIIFLFSSQILELIGINSKYKFWIYFIPLSVFSYGVYNFFNYWLIRKKAFVANSVNKAIRRGAEGIVQVIFCAIGNPIGLLVGDIVGNIANIFAGFKQVFKRGFSFSQLSKLKAIAMAKKYSDFPLYNSIPAFLNTGSRLLPIIFISRNYSGFMAGQFDLCKLIFIVPVSLVSASVSQVLLQKVAELRIVGSKVTPTIIGFAAFLFLLAITVLAFFVFFSESFFSFFFGDQWHEAASMAKIFVWNFAVIFFISPLTVAFTALNKIRIGSFWQFSYSIIIFSFLLFFDYSKGIYSFLTIYTIINVIAYTIYLFMLLYVTLTFDKSIHK